MGDTLGQCLPVAFSLKTKSPSRWIWPVELSVFRTNRIISSTHSYKEKDSQLEGWVVWIQFNSVEKRYGRQICHKPDEILNFWNIGWRHPHGTCSVWEDRTRVPWIIPGIFTNIFIVLARSSNQMFLTLWNIFLGEIIYSLFWWQKKSVICF